VPEATSATGIFRQLACFLSVPPKALLKTTGIAKNLMGKKD
jgi:hypothetical protein